MKFETSVVKGNMFPRLPYFGCHGNQAYFDNLLHFEVVYAQKKPLAPASGYM